MELDTEFWFGVEICVYVIFPLLLLTVFGTVNCCKVSLSSRMLPTKQVQAIKINIAVTVSTNIALFLFLVPFRVPGKKIGDRRTNRQINKRYINLIKKSFN